MIVLLAAGAALAGCNRASPAQGQGARAPERIAAYLPPPQVTQATRQDATVLLTGTAAPRASIRLASPDGSAVAAIADGKGAFIVPAPAGPAPRLYSLSETLAGRLVRAVGYVAVLPAPAPAAALLRPASAALLPPTDGQKGLVAVDFDASGAARASGRASASETIRLYLDGKEAAEDTADAAGAFNVALSQTLTPGPHVLSLAAQRLRASAGFVVVRISRLSKPPFDAVRVDNAWRIDWMTPGGGLQSTILFDRKGGRG